LNVSRRIPAIAGFLLAAFGMFMVIHSNSVVASVLFLAIAVFGADATLSPSWAFCIDIGKQSSGTVGALMNMAGNFGAVVTAVSYPYLFQLTGSNEPFFYLCILLAILAVFSWLKMDATNSINNR
jgi:ACS family glucarate transporter-like MFS transporter